MEAVHSSETSVTLYQLMQCDIPWNLNLHQCCCGNLGTQNRTPLWHKQHSNRVTHKGKICHASSELRSISSDGTTNKRTHVNGNISHTTRVITKVMTNSFLHAYWEQQMKESAMVDGTSCCVILECLVTSIACIT